MSLNPNIRLAWGIICRWGLFSLALLLVSLGSCSPPGAANPAADGRLRIVTTTGLLGDAVRHIVGDRAEVVALMGPGVDPHLYKASHGDVKRLSRADVIVYNGLHLEGKMGEVLRKVGRHKPVVAVAEGLAPHQLKSLQGSDSAYDPHIWFDVQLWKQAVLHLSQKLQELDPSNQALYRERTATYVRELEELDTWIRAEMQRIPDHQRVLITAHDAFGYFGVAYGVEVRGLQGLSTLSDFGLRDVSDLVQFIVDRQVGAIFVETSVSTRAIEAVLAGARQRGHRVRLGGTLYSDALGPADTPAGSYTGMVRDNVKTIVEGLALPEPALSRR